MNKTKILAVAMSMAVMTITYNYSAQNVMAAAAKKPAVVSSQLQGTELKNIRVGGTRETTRIVLDLSGAKKYKYFFENNNTRLVINIDGMYTSLKEAPASTRGILKDMILGKYGDTLQLIVDMKAAVPVKVYTLKNPDRIVVDLTNEYEDEKTTQVEAGLVQKKYVRFDSRGMLTAYLLDIDPNKFDVRMALPTGQITTGYGRLTDIVRRNNAVAGVNGGYFDFFDKFLIGDVRIDGLTAGMGAETRAGLIKKKNGGYAVGKASYSGTVTVNGRSISFWGVNAPRGKDSIVLYNRLYGATTGTNEYGSEYVISKGMVQEVNKGNSVIPEDGVVVSVHGESQALFADVRKGDRAVISESFGDEIADGDDFYGAGPQLLKDGQVSITAAEENIASNIVNGRAPRTALGIAKNGHILLMVVDGRQSHSIGSSLSETAQLLKKFGAVQGVNYDGGGSSEMVLNNRIISKPSGGAERSIGNALIVVRK
ncbi:MAG: phosphodiester glycosidase family protein [Anaerovibrio sp.]|uniref:phosphodiester glycosidase family protein n=1 Tax=Anaerovibrio sp. TaxID=1872532 RepID=UPI0025EFB13B|nr:phosphodiester glycosidase family protein [Anaerovibrio sp.]MCR5176206.1 phosphodiester glycosidase family protein [Anaerovibrio sp.]